MISAAEPRHGKTKAITQMLPQISPCPRACLATRVGPRVRAFLECTESPLGLPPKCSTATFNMLARGCTQAVYSVSISTALTRKNDTESYEICREGKLIQFRLLCPLASMFLRFVKKMPSWPPPTGITVEVKGLRMYPGR